MENGAIFGGDELHELDVGTWAALSEMGDYTLNFCFLPHHSIAFEPRREVLSPVPVPRSPAPKRLPRPRNALKLHQEGDA